MGSFIAQGNSLILFISTSIGSMKNLLTLIWERVVYAGASFFLPHLMAQLSQMPLVIFLLFFLATVMVIFFGFFLQRTYRKLRNYFSTGKSASKQASSFFPLAKKENQKKRLARQTKKELLFIDKRFPAIAVVAVLLTAMFAYNWPERYQLANLIPSQTLQRSVSNPTNSTQVAGEADSSSEKETLSTQTKTILEKHPNLYALLAPTETSTQNLKLGGMLLTRHGELFIASGTVVSDSIQRHGIKNINLGTNSVTSRVIKNGTISSEDLASTLTISRLKLDQALATTEGGTGLTHYVPGDLLYYAQGQTLTRLPIGSVNQVLKADGSGLSWQPETSYSASGQLLQLANQNFSLKEGTLDDGKICTYSVTTGLECTTTAGSVGVNYWTMSSNNLYPNNLTDNLALGATNAGSAKLYVNGNVGVGTTNPFTALEVAGNAQILDNISDSNTHQTGLYVTHTASNSAYGYAIGGEAYTGLTGDKVDLWGQWLYAENDSSGNLNRAVGLFIYGTGNQGGGTITNNIGLYIEDQTVGATNFAIKTGLGKVSFGDNVGIGTTSPVAKLDVNDGNINITGRRYIAANTNDTFAYDGKTMGSYGLGWFDDSWDLGGSTSWLSGYAGIKFFTAGLPRLSITNSGNVGIGTTNPIRQLDVFTPGQGHVTFGGANGRTLQALDASGNSGNFDFYSLQTYFNGDLLVGGKISSPNGTNQNLYLTTNNSSYAIYTDRNIGIGTTAPANALDVNTGGGIHITTGTPGSTAMALYNNSGTLTWNGSALATGGSISGTLNYIGKFTSTSSMGISSIYDNGNVGIGTTNPGAYMLNVNGTSYLGGNIATAGTFSFPNSNTLTGVSGYARFNAGISVGGAENYYINSSGAANLSSLTVAGAISSGGYKNLTNDNLLVNGDFETNSSVGWSGVTSVTTGGYAGNYTAQFTGSTSLASDDYIPVDPTRDVLQLEAFVKKTVTGTTPGVLYFGYYAYDANKTFITSAPCGTYCYFATSGWIIPVDGSWHKVSATSSGEGTVFPNFPVGTKFIRVLGLVNYGGSSDTVTQIDHISLRRINSGPLFVGNNFSSTNLIDQYQVSKIFTTSSNALTLEPSSGGTINFSSLSSNPIQLTTLNNNHLTLMPNGTGNVGIGTTAPSAKLALVSSTAATGGIGFGTDTNLYRSAANTLTASGNFNVGSSAPTIASSFNPVIINTVDSDGDVGEMSSIAIGADGLARISYYSSNVGLKFAKCSNINCSTKTTAILDVGNYVGAYSSIALGPDGFPRISYFETYPNKNLKFIQCTDDICSTKIITTVDALGENNGFGGNEKTSIAIGTDGFARISYYDQINDDLKFAQCTNVDCSTKNITTIDSSGDVGSNSSTVLGTDGFARISYYAGGGGLKFAQCTNADCSTKNITTVDSSGWTGWFSSIALGTDGFARIGYYSSSNSLKFIQCTNADCSTKNIATVDSAGDVGYGCSIVLGNDGFARISYGDQIKGHLKFAQCTNIACTTKNIITADPISYAVWSSSSIALGSDGSARVSYYAGSDGLKFARIPSNTSFMPNGNDLAISGSLGVSSDILTDGTLVVGGSTKLSGPVLIGADVNNITGKNVQGWLKTTVDSTGDVGSLSSINLGSGNLARISYYDYGNYDLKFVQCLDTSCSSKNTTTVDSSGYVGDFNSSALGSDGFARISYYDNSNYDLKLAQCTNASCTTKNITIVDSAGDVGMYSSMALGGDGFARISYFDDTNDDLKFAQCTNATCTTNNITTVDSAGDMGRYSSMALGADGFARIIYLDNTNFALKFVQCTNADCSTKNINTVNSEYFRSTPKMVIGLDGLARISYLSNQGTKFVQCTNADCSTKNITLINSVSNDSGQSSSLAIGTDGFARISYFDDTNQNLVFVQCTNATCTTKNISTVDDIGSVGWNSSIALGTDGFARISYYDSTNRSLKFAVRSNEGTRFTLDTTTPALFLNGMLGVKGDAFLDGDLAVQGGLNLASGKFVASQYNFTSDGVTSLASLDANGQFSVKGGLKISDSTPTDTSNALYSANGTLTWNGRKVLMPTATAGQTLYSDGANWLASSNLYNNGANVGIGTTNPTAFKLQVAGSLGPDLNNAYDLGSATNRWKDMYLGAGAINMYGAYTDAGNFELGKISFNTHPNATQDNSLDFDTADEANFQQEELKGSATTFTASGSDVTLNVGMSPKVKIGCRAKLAGTFYDLSALTDTTHFSLASAPPASGSVDNIYCTQLSRGVAKLNGYAINAGALGSWTKHNVAATANEEWARPIIYDSVHSKYVTAGYVNNGTDEDAVAWESTDLTTWTRRDVDTETGDQHIRGLIYDSVHNKYIAVGSDEIASEYHKVVWESTDLISWTERDIEATGRSYEGPRVIVYNSSNGKYVVGGDSYDAGGASTSSDAVVWESTDLINWTRRIIDAEAGYQTTTSLIYDADHGKYVASGDDTNIAVVWESTDLITWTERLIEDPGSGYNRATSVIYDSTHAKYVAMGYDNTNDVVAWESTDLINWTKRVVQTSISSWPAQIIYDPIGNRYLIGGYYASGTASGNDACVWESEDLVNWTRDVIDASDYEQRVLSIIYDQNHQKYVAAGYSQSGNGWDYTDAVVWEVPGAVYSYPTDNYYAIATTDSNQINSSAWDDLNSVTVSETLNSQIIDYAVSFNGRTTWAVYTGSHTKWRNIVKNDLGTWKYNTNASWGVETWVAATANTQAGALEQAFGISSNRMTGTDLNGISDGDWNKTNGWSESVNTLDFAAGLKTSAINFSPALDQISVNYDPTGVGALAISTSASGTGQLRPINFQIGSNDRVLFLDTTGNIGIGTAAPAGLLDVGGGLLTVLPTGKVGIGTTNPGYKLEVNGLTAADGIRTNIGLDFYQVPDPVAPSGTPILTSGNLNSGTYYYVVMYYTDLGQTHISNGSAAVMTDGTHQQVTVAIPVSTDSRVIGRKIYRTLVNDAGGWSNARYLATIYNNTATTYVDNIADGGLGAEGTMPYWASNTTSKQLTVNGNNAVFVDNQGTYVGYLSGQALSGAPQPTLFGSQAGMSITKGGFNTLIGAAAGHFITTGMNNTALGRNALYNIDTSSYNTAVGWNGLELLTSGDSNTVLGNAAGNRLTTGSNNIFLGNQAGVRQTSVSNLLIIDNQDRGSAASEATNALIYGNFASTPANQKLTINGNVGIGTINPGSKLVIIGSGIGGAALPSGQIDIKVDNYEAGVAHDSSLVLAGSSASYATYSRILNTNNGNYSSLQLQTRAAFTTVWQTGLTVDAQNGNVGIGTASPQKLLDINGDAYIRGNLTFANSGDHFIGGASTGINLKYTYWNGSVDMPWLTLLNGGNVGIGTANPVVPFQLAGQGRMDTGLDFSYVTAPATIPTATVNSVAGNVPIGQHRYLVTYVTVIGETEHAGITSAVNVTAGNQQVTLTNVPVSSDYRVIKRRIYRDDNDYNFTRYVDIGDNTTTTFVDNYANGSMTVGSSAWYIPNTTNKFITQNGSPVFTINGMQTAMGSGAGAAFTPAVQAAALFGSNAGRSLTGFANSGFGYNALNSLTGGGQNVAVGAWAGFDNNWSDNTLVGFGAGHNYTGGINAGGNVIVGSYSGGAGKDNMNGGQINGSNSVIIGRYAGTSLGQTAFDNSIAIGYNALVSASNQVVLGNSSITQTLLNGNVGIGTTNPTSKLDVAGDIKATNVGVSKFYVSNTGLIGLSFNGTLEWSSDIEAANAGDIGLARNTTGVLKITDGATGFGTLIAGNVGIGTTNPGVQLQIGDMATSGTRYAYIVDANLGLKLSNTGIIQLVGAAGNLEFKANNTNSGNYIFSSTGNVGIGTTNPGLALDVVGNARFSAIGSGAYTGAVNRMADGTLTTATSDVRFKKDITTIDNPLDKVLALRGVTFNWKDPNNPKRMLGMIAQEVLPIVPELVFQSSDGYYGINYGETSGLLIEAIKQQQGEITGITNNQNQIVAKLTGQLADQNLSVDSKLKLIGETLSTINANTQILETQPQLVSDLQAQVAKQTQDLVSLQKQMADIQTQNKAFNDFLLAFDVKNIDNFAQKNAPLNVFTGQLEANSLVAGAFSVKVVDKTAPTIGKSVICKSDEALKNDGNCVGYVNGDTSLEQSDGKSVIIKTTAISADSKIFVTPKVVTDQPLAATKIVPGVSFTVEVKDMVMEDLDFDWFVVEEK